MLLKPGKKCEPTEIKRLYKLVRTQIEEGEISVAKLCTIIFVDVVFLG